MLLVRHGVWLLRMIVVCSHKVYIFLWADQVSRENAIESVTTAKLSQANQTKSGHKHATHTVVHLLRDNICMTDREQQHEMNPYLLRPRSHVHVVHSTTTKGAQLTQLNTKHRNKQRNAIPCDCINMLCAMFSVAYTLSHHTHTRAHATHKMHINDVPKPKCNIQLINVRGRWMFIHTFCLAIFAILAIESAHIVRAARQSHWNTFFSFYKVDNLLWHFRCWPNDVLALSSMHILRLISSKIKLSLFSLTKHEKKC